MNFWWLAAGLLCLVTAFVHTVAGHFNPVLPFLRAELEATVKATLYACWHMVTVTLFLSALALLGLGLSPGLAGARLLAAFLAGLYLLSGLVFLVIGARWFQALTFGVKRRRCHLCFFWLSDTSWREAACNRPRRSAWRLSSWTTAPMSTPHWRWPSSARRLPEHEAQAALASQERQAPAASRLGRPLGQAEGSCPSYARRAPHS